jgi:hypothetical protein
MRNFTWEMNSIGKVLVFYTDEMMEMCNVPIRISCQTNDSFSSIKFEITMNLKQKYLHFDCKIDVQVHNPIGLIHNLTTSCQMTFVHEGK